MSNSHHAVGLSSQAEKRFWIPGLAFHIHPKFEFVLLVLGILTLLRSAQLATEGIG